VLISSSYRIFGYLSEATRLRFVPIAKYFAVFWRAFYAIFPIGRPFSIPRENIGKVVIRIPQGSLQKTLLAKGFTMSLVGP